MRQLAKIKCKRDARHVDNFAIELYSEDKLKPDQVPFYLQNKRNFESLVATDGKIINLNRYYYYEVVSVEDVEE